MEDLRRYLKDIVEPTVRDFEDQPTSVRHAFLACLATFHSVDYLAFPAEPDKLRRQFRAESDDFRIVDGVAHAFKHVATSKKPNKGVKAWHVISRPPAIAGELECGVSTVGDYTGGVTIWNNMDIDLLSSIRGAVEFLRSKVRG